MAFPTKSGKSFGSAYVAKRHDKEHEKAAQGILGGDKHEAAETPEFEKGEQEGQTEQPEQNEHPSQVVSQHGPANTVHIAHDHKAKKHHVISTHKDGHVHESEHATASEAHNHASELAGGDQPSAEATGAAPAAPEADGFSMPRLA